MSSLAHFTGVLYSPAWVFTLSVYSYRFPKTSNIEQTEVKHSRFFVCSHQRNKNDLTLGCLSEQINKKTVKRN